MIRFRCAAVVMLHACLLANPCAAAEQLVTGKLVPGKGGTYGIPLESGQYIQILLGVTGTDAEAILKNSGGQTIVKTLVTAGSETRLAAIADSVGLWIVDLQASPPDSIGQYLLRITEPRTATPRDRLAVQAQTEFTKGKQLGAAQTDDSQRRAISHFEEALRLWRSAGDRSGEADALIGRGDVRQARSESKKALDDYNAALSIRRDIGDRRGEGEALGNIGDAYFNLGDRGRALEHLQRALTVSRAAGDVRREAGELNDLGVVYNATGKGESAIASLNLALALRRTLGDRRGQGETLTNLGLSYGATSRKQQAIHAYEQALALVRVAHDRYTEAATLNNLAEVYSTLGEKQKALDYYSLALPIEEEVVDQQGEINTSLNLGHIYEELGEKETALELYRRALPLARKIEDRQLEMVALVHTASIEEDSGRKEQALALYDQALPLAEVLQDRRWKSIILNNSANVYAYLGHKEKAFDLYKRALALGREIGDVQAEAIALTDLGDISAAMKSEDKARKYYNEALSVCRSAGDRRTEALTLFGMARLERASGNLVAALAKIKESLRLLESLRKKIAVSELRASYAASVRRYFDFYIDTLMDFDPQDQAHTYAALALEASERSRARSLLDLLGESRVDIRQGVDAALLAKERALNAEIDDRGQRYLRVAGNSQQQNEARAIKERLSSSERELQGVEAAIRQTSPRYTALLQPRTLTPAEIQREARDGDTLILEYALGETRSYLWVVDHERIYGYRLPRREEIDRLARGFYKQLSTPGLANTSSDELSAVVLGPAKSLLGTKRLVIVPDGSLQFISFAALRDPASPRFSPVPLVMGHEIAYAPSVSVLAVLRRERSGRRPAPKAVAILADPVFSSADARLHGSAPLRVEAMQQVLEKSLERSLATIGDSDLPRLPFSRLEAESVALLFNKSQVTKALDFEASVATATDPRLSQYRVIHFATHGIMNAVDPTLSGLVLSLFDNRGKPRVGFLKLTNIYNLKLRADLVVLSGCRTGLGKEINGEGLVGLTRGFMYAGAPSVVATLWNVNDSATAEFMKRFYRAMFMGKMRPAAALRFAQQSFFKEHAYTSPYYWAPFLLSGEWN